MEGFEFPESRRPYTGTKKTNVNENSSMAIFNTKRKKKIVDELSSMAIFHM